MSHIDDITRSISFSNDLTADEIARLDIPETMTMADLEFLPDLDALDQDGLQTLHERLEALYSALERDEPDAASDARDDWEESLEEVSDLLDEVLARLEDMDGLLSEEQERTL